MRLILSLFFVLPSLLVNGQNTVIVTKVVKTVPAGKKWILKANTKIRVQISDGSLNSGTFCNGSLQSNPGMAGSIYKGDYHNSVGYGIFFSALEKIPFSNNNTYSLTPISFFDRSFKLSDLNHMSPKNIGVSQLEFREGETVFTGNCIDAVELIEENVSSKRIEKIQPNNNINWDIKSIMNMESASELFQAFGKENVVLMGKYDAEDNEIGDAYFVFNETNNTLQVEFDRTGVTYISCKKVGAKWKFPYGLFVGDTLRKVIKVNEKDFEVYGFEWDGAGFLKSWNNGKLQNSGIMISIGTSNKSNNKMYSTLVKEQQNIIKEQLKNGNKSAGAHSVIFKTDNPLLRKVGFVLTEIILKNISNSNK